MCPLAPLASLAPLAPLDSLFPWLWPLPPSTSLSELCDPLRLLWPAPKVKPKGAKVKAKGKGYPKEPKEPKRPKRPKRPKEPKDTSIPGP